MNNQRPLCIYHGGCDDGFGAAWAVRQALGVNVDFYPGVYQQEPPNVAGRDVIMVDFSYKRPVLDKMAAIARSILILDHHKTAAEDLADVPMAPAFNVWEPTPAGMWAIFDMNRSGAGLAWDYFHPGIGNRPPFINYIEDRDLWRKALPNGDEFTIALRSYPQDFAVWDELSTRTGELIEQGHTIQRYYRMRVEELKRHAYPTKLGGASCYISNAPYFAASEVAGELCDAAGAEFGACYFEVAKGEFQYSLRSRGDFDVSAIAKKFGGGGHKNAAGFKTVGIVHEVHTIPAFLAKDAPLP